ncbi:hypothetical protein EDB76_01375 [Helicobacter pylori]|nr:hypothetical protein EDB76_01375 [Helicobacter pylori]
MAWLETSNRFKDTPKISFKTRLLKKGILSKLFIIFLKSYGTNNPNLLRISNTLNAPETIRSVIDLWSQYIIDWF